jgi:predicted RNase H-related nuclease YkuK (DUF458 family)
MQSFDVEQVKQFIASSSPETKVYLGADSERVSVAGRWFADYTLAVVVHKDGKHGCKVFGYVDREPDWSQTADKPSLRLMQEVYKVSELFQQLSSVLQDRYVEVHLDINPSDRYKSNQVIQQAVGYIRGTCNLEAQVKPHAFAASYAADRLKFLLGTTQNVRPI